MSLSELNIKTRDVQCNYFSPQQNCSFVTIGIQYDCGIRDTENKGEVTQFFVAYFRYLLCIIVKVKGVYEDYGNVRSVGKMKIHLI